MIKEKNKRYPVIELIEVPNRANNPRKPPAHIIREDIFKYYYLKLNYTQKEFTHILKINHRIFRRSLYTYYTKEEVEMNRRIRCSRSAKLRDPSTLKRGPRKIIPRDLLKIELERENTLRSIGRKFNVSSAMIKTNIRYHKLKTENLRKITRALESDDVYILEKFDKIKPGIKNLIEEGYHDNKLEVIQELFLLYEELDDYRLWIKDRIQRLRKQLNRRHIDITSIGISFAGSRLEKRVKDLLIDHGIQFIPQFKIRKEGQAPNYYFYDFFIPTKNLLIECNGAYYHNHRVKEDNLKKIRAQELGYKIISFSDKEIIKDIEKVGEKIKDA